MAITVGGTTITFSDGTTQSTAGGAPTTTQVLNATAGASAGAVGTYALMLRSSGEGTISTGATFAGSSLRYTCTYVISRDNKGMQFTQGWTGGPGVPMGGTSTGTWRCMGYAPYYTFSSGDYSYEGQAPSLFLRIS